MNLEHLRERMPSSRRFIRDLAERQGMRLYPTDFGVVPYDQIISPGKELLYMFPGFGGVREDRGAIEEVATRYSTVELGEPIDEGITPHARTLQRSVRDSHAFEQFIDETMPQGEKGIFVCPSFAALTGIDYTLRNLDRVSHLVLLVPAGFRQRDNPFHISYRYLRESIRTGIPSVKEKGRDGLKGTLLTAKKIVADAQGSLDRMHSVLTNKLDPTEIMKANILITAVLAASDGLFDAKETETKLREIMTQIQAARTGEAGLIFSEDAETRLHIRRRAGGHDMGCNGNSGGYGKIIVNEIDETHATIQPVR